MDIITEGHKLFPVFLLLNDPYTLFVAVMHDLRLIHTDLKPENILLVSADCIRVPDYKVMVVFLLTFIFQSHW